MSDTPKTDAVTRSAQYWPISAEVVPVHFARAQERRIHDLSSALRELLQDTQHVNHNCGDGPDLCPVLNAQQVLDAP